MPIIEKILPPKWGIFASGGFAVSLLNYPQFSCLAFLDSPPPPIIINRTLLATSLWGRASVLDPRVNHIFAATLLRPLRSVVRIGTGKNIPRPGDRAEVTLCESDGVEPCGANRWLLPAAIPILPTRG